MKQDFLDGSIRRLNHIRRYSSYPVIRQENVAEHSFWIAFYAYRIGKELQYKYKEKVNYEALLEKAMLHDFEESKIGDVVRTFKYYNDAITTAMKDAEKKVTSDLFDELFEEEASKEVFKKWEAAKDVSLEGQIVMVSDMVCVFAYCIEEIELGNKFAEKTLREAIDGFEKLVKTRIMSLVLVGVCADILELAWQYDSRALVFGRK